MKTSLKVGTAGAGAIMLAVSFIQPWEGLWLTAKVDTIGTGKPVTACYGETEGVKLGEHFTEAQCTAMLKAKLPRYDAEISRCIHVPISEKERAAYISFSYNVGSAGFCKSSLLKKLNAGNSRAACEGLLAWNRAGGKFVKGLANRREAERRLCIEGLNDVKREGNKGDVRVPPGHGIPNAESWYTRQINWLKSWFGKG